MENYGELYSELLQNYKAPGCTISLKILDSVELSSHENLGAVIDEHDSVVEKHY